MSDLSGDLRGGPVEEAKIDNLHLHDLRHHFASWFVMRGGSLQALKKLLGHADLKMTLRYAHLAPPPRSAGPGARRTDARSVLGSGYDASTRCHLRVLRARGLRASADALGRTRVVPGGRGGGMPGN